MDVVKINDDDDDDEQTYLSLSVCKLCETILTILSGNREQKFALVLVLK